MKERPILFSGEMVRALLDGRKTQTRRALKRQFLDVLPLTDKSGWIGLIQRGSEGVGPKGEVFRCKFGAPGDELYMRETWAWPGEEQVIYRADPESAALVERWKQDPNFPQVKWRPSIHMPRWASRISLLIIDVRVERLNDISNDDAAAEGWPGADENNSIASAYPVAWYWHLWDKINGAGAWDLNPWVWAISFERVMR